jgi:hypothetical protein
MEEGSDEGDSEDDGEEEEEDSQVEPRSFIKASAPELESVNMDDIKDDYLDEDALLDTNIVIESHSYICIRKPRERKLLLIS